MADKTIGELTRATHLDDDSLLIAEQGGEAVSVPGSLFKEFARQTVSGLAAAADEAAEQAATSAVEAERSASAANEAAEEAANSAAAAATADAAAARAANSAAAAERFADSIGTAAESAANSAAAAASAAQNVARDANAASASANEAALAANAAAQSALSVDADEINTRIATKGDSLEFDSETNLLWLTSGGERIGEGIKVATTGGGGGGGGESNNAVLTLKNTTGWIYKTLAAGAACPISMEWSSIEDGMATGDGVLKITVNGTAKHIAQVEQGTVTLDIGEWLSAGSCAVKATVSDVYGNSRAINFNITCVALSLDSSFDATLAYTGAIAYPYTPTGSTEKTVHFLLDGKEIGTATIATSGRQQTFNIPAQKHGSHTFEVYFTALVANETVESNHLYYDLICTEAGNTATIIASPFKQSEAEQYDNIAIPYIVYNPAGLTAEVVLSADGQAVQELTVDRTQQTWTYRPTDFGELELTIESGGAVKSFGIDISESTVQVEAETENLALYLSSYGRSNNEANPGTWSHGGVSAEFTGFNFTSDGWKSDAEGITALRVAGDARLHIPTQIFASDFRTTGKTIEIEFATRDVLNYDAPIITCYSGDRGLNITAQKATLKSEQSEISTQYKEDEHVRLTFVVEKRSAHRLLMIYINGVLSGAVQYPADDDFSQANPVGISVGSSECTTDLYCIRVYDNDLTRYQVLDNWIADTQDAVERTSRWRHNNVFDDYGSIVIAQLPTDLPYLILSGEALPTYKGNKLPVSGEYVDPANANNSFTFADAEIDVQGTSSAGYERKNFKIEFKDGFVQGGTKRETYVLGKNNVPTNTFTFKADVASSEGANNVELVKLYDDISPYATPPQSTDDRVRQGIDGYPIVIFHNDGNATTFIGKYNFNHDKATPEVFGFDTNDESWETKNNTSNRALWKDPDFSGTDWQNDFEARHPEDNTDVTNLAALAAWIASTDRDAVSGASAKATRLAKFKNEVGNWMDIDSTLFYYLFTELFLLADSRTKNSFPTKYDGGKWCWLPYDMDTALGINNEGKLAFGYELEDTDLVNGAQVYTGQKSVLWNNVRDAFPEKLMEMYQKLRSDGILSYENVERRFREHQAKWPEAIFNEDAYYKYLAPLFDKNNGSYLGMLQGSKAEQRKWWLYNRFRYIDSKYNAGDALKDFITLRGYAKGDIEIKPYADIYATVKYGSYLVQKRALRGDSYILECPVDDLDDTEIYIYSASQLADVGDLSSLMVGYAEFAAGTKLNNLKLGDAAASYSNPNLTQLYLGNNVLLKTLDVRNCPNLGNTAADVNATPAINLGGCANIEHVYFDNTAITGLTLPNGGIVKTLHLPSTMTNLTIRNQTAITDFVMPNYGNITTLRLENVSAAVPTKDILYAIPANSRVRLIGFDWSFNSATDILALCDRLDTMRGLDEQGNNVDKAQISGTVRVADINGDQLASIWQRYPDINVVYENLTAYLYFYDTAGANLLQILEVKNGGDGVYTSATPTKESDAQYNYTFVGWSKTVGGEADANALKNVETDRSVYAAFTTTVRIYTVRFYNGTTLLQTVTAPYGGTATYTGSTPETSEPDYEFAGFSPDGTNITGDTDCYAQYRYTGLSYVKLIERSIVSYSSYSLIEIGLSAFYSCKQLTTVDCPMATSIGVSAFESCGMLSTVNFPSVTSIGDSAFKSGSSNDGRLAKVDLPAATSIGKNAFYGQQLNTLILRAPTVCALGSATALTLTSIYSGSGYIYVPAALVDSYKVATNWSNFANQFRAIEDYPEITGGES